MIGMVLFRLLCKYIYRFVKIKILSYKLKVYNVIFKTHCYLKSAKVFIMEWKYNMNTMKLDDYKVILLFVNTITFNKS